MRQHNRLISLLTLLSFSLLMSLASVARAADISWINPAGGDWFTPENWSSGTVPTAADNVSITLPGTYTVTANIGSGFTADAANLALGGGSGTQTLALSGGGDLHVVNQATISATGVLSLSYGTLSGTFNIAPGGQFNMSPGYSKGIDTINNAGTINWVTDRDDIMYGGTINNLAGGVFNNQAGTQVTNTWQGPVLNNAGTVNGISGTLLLFAGGGGSHDMGTGSGVFNAEVGSDQKPRIEFTGVRQYVLTNGTRFTGPGMTALGDARLAVQGTATVEGNFSQIDNDSLLSGTTPLTIASGGTYNWQAGPISADLTINAGGNLNLISGGKNLSGTINNSGTTNWNTTSDDAIGKYGYSTDPTTFTFNNLAGGVFNNLAKVGSTNTIAGIEFNNAGTVNGQSGTLVLTNRFTTTGTSKGTFNAAAGTGIRIRFEEEGGHIFAAGARFTGPGTTQFAGKVNFDGAATVTGTVEANEAAQLTGDATLTVASGGNFNWKDGSIGNTLAIATGGKLNISQGTGNGKYLAGTINNSGIATWTSRSDDGINWGGDVETPSTFNNLAGGVFNNVATSTATNTLGANGAIEFDNAGAVNGQSGKLLFNTGFQDSTTSGSSTGTFNAAATGTGYRISFTGNGHYFFNRGTRFIGPGVTELNGHLTVQGATTVQSTMEQTGQIIDGDAVVTVASGGNYNWKGGEIDGTLTISTGGHLNLAQSSNGKSLGGIINNSGITTWAGRGSDSIGAGGDTESPRTFNNKAGGVFNTVSTSTGSNTVGEGIDFVNAGTLNIGGTSPGSFTISGDYTQTSTGTLTIQLGGTSSTQFDQLAVGGKATLGGTVNVVAVGSYLPAYLSTYKFLTFGTRAGAFTKVSGDLSGNRTLRVVYHANDASLVTSIDPTISSFTPASAAAGQTVTISGTNFIDVGQVMLNGQQVTFSHPSATVITFKVPTTATSGKLTVINPAGTAISLGVLKVLPSITSFTPTSGPVGTSVRVTGANLTGATSVTFRGGKVGLVNATFTRVSATTIQVTVPVGAEPGPITITTPGGTTSSNTPFTVTEIQHAGLVGVATPVNLLSSATASAATSSVQLKWLVALDAEVASDPAHYTVEVSGHTVSVESAAYNAQTKSVTLSLPEGSLQPGDHVVVAWNDLALHGQSVDGQTPVVLARF